jgi:hypothetical protein
MYPWIAVEAASRARSSRFRAIDIGAIDGTIDVGPCDRHRDPKRFLRWFSETRRRGREEWRQTFLERV